MKIEYDILGENNAFAMFSTKEVLDILKRTIEATKFNA